MRRRFVVAAILFAPSVAHASAPDLFGQGSRSAALAQSDVAAPDPAVAAYAGPTAAAEPGTRVIIGYGHAYTRLTFDGARAPIEDIGGTTMAFQLGREVTRDLRLGLATSLYLPDRGIARVSFRAASEPAFVRWDTSPERLTVDAVVAARYSIVSLAVGAALSAKAGGPGVNVDLPQDARGAHADGQANVTLAYQAAPIVGVAIDLGDVGLAARLRGSTGVGVDLVSTVDVAFHQNPLDGTTRVEVAGRAGYDPLTVDLAARYAPAPWLRAFAALQYARWRDAPQPIASFDLALNLGITPSELHGVFDGPPMHDTLSPRVGVELAPAGTPLRARLGYAFAPSPVGKANGFLTPVDLTRHVLAAGGGLALDDVLGVSLAIDLHAALHLAVHDDERKDDLALPWAAYDAGGHVVDVGASLTGGFR